MPRLSSGWRLSVTPWQPVFQKASIRTKPEKVCHQRWRESDRYSAGSRSSELKYLAEPFLDTARWLAERHDNIRFIVPAPNAARHDFLSRLIAEKYSDLNIQLVMKHSRDVMSIADAILIASGTATLEATILQKPMVVAYKMASLTYAIYSRMLKAKYISLPNLLADEQLVPEILQDDVQPEILGLRFESTGRLAV